MDGGGSVFRNRTITRAQALKAIGVGSIVGAAGVFLFLLIFWLVTKQEIEDDGAEEASIPVQQFEGETSLYYATQFGAFSSVQGAEQFKNGFPTLNKALIVEVDGQYYVWSRVTLAPKEEATIPSSFNKAFYVSAKSCEDEALAQLTQNMKNEELLKSQNPQITNGVLLPDDFEQVKAQIHQLSTDGDVVRLYMLQHYTEQNDCVKIGFSP